MMKKKDSIEAEESLMLMRVIDTNPQMTQRELSSHLGLSLGKINFLMKAMIEKGFIKTNNFKNSNNKIAYLYYLTPRGIEEKAKITYHFFKRKIEEYEKLEIEIRLLKEEMDSTNLSVKGQK
ncbi:MAG: MarR family EPS-associated transcriptional regulator [Smithella sp.]